MVIAIAKLLLPILREFLREIFTPGSEQQRTSALGRASVLLNLTLILLLAFAAEKAVFIHSERIRAETKVEALNSLVTEYRETIARLERDNNELEEQLREPPPIVQPAPVNDPAPIKRSANSEPADRRRIISDINE